MLTLVDFFDLLLAALLVGAMFAIWLLFNPKDLDGQRYIELQQHGIRRLNTALPVLGLATILLTILAGVVRPEDPVRRDLLFAAAAGFLVAGAVTRFLNQPINKVVIQWSAAAPPPDWMKMRDAWWRWHLLRFICAIGGLCALILANLDIS